MSGLQNELREDVPSVKAGSGLSDMETRVYLSERLKELETDKERTQEKVEELEAECRDRVKPLKLSLVNYEIVITALRNTLWKMSSNQK